MVKGQFVIIYSDQTDALNLSEIKIYNNSVIVSNEAYIYADSLYSATEYLPELLVDGFTGTFAHTSVSQDNKKCFFIINLKSEYSITKIEIYNRNTGRNRIVNSTISVLNNVYASSIGLSNNIDTNSVIPDTNISLDNIENNSLFFTTLLSNAMTITVEMPPPTPTLDTFTITPTDITFETNGTINMEFNNEISETDISNSLSVDPSNAGTIIDILNTTGNEWTAIFVPNYYLNLSDCSLQFINTGYSINETINFNIETLQQIQSIVLTPENIITDLSSNLHVELRIPSTVAPIIQIEPSYIASLDGSMNTVDNLNWTGTIKRTEGMNSLDNTITVEIDGVSGEITFDVLDTLLPSEYYIMNNGNKILYSQFPIGSQYLRGKIEVFDVDNKSVLTEDNVESVSVNKEGDLIVIGLPEIIKSYIFKQGNWQDGSYNDINGSNLGELVHLTKNNGLIVTNNITGSNFELDIYKEKIERLPTDFLTNSETINYPDNSLNFIVRLTTNDVLLSQIKTESSSLFSIDPSNVGYIDSSNLYLSDNGFTINGKFIVSGEQNNNNVKLFYNNFSSSQIILNTVLDLSINDFNFDSSFVTYLNHTTNKITLDLNRDDIDNIDISNSLTLDPSDCGFIKSVMNSSGSSSFIKEIIFEPAYNFENENCSLIFDYNEGLLEITETINFSVNNYVPQISEITNDNLFNYVDTSGIILLEFDRNLLRDLSLNDLSYDETKLDLQLEKISESSYNLIVDPSGEYKETQVITVKDLLGTDLSNITLNIDTVIPSISEISMHPNMLTYGATEGILDVKFNKKLLDRDQLVLEKSSNISYSFKQQLDETSASIVVTEVNNSLETELMNFTYTIEGDASENIVKSALQKWDNIIKRHPIDVKNFALGGTTKMHITFNVSEMDAGTLGYAYVDYVYYDDLNHNGEVDYSDNIYTSSGFISLSQASYNSMISETRTDSNTTLYYVLMHEIGHIIGIGPYFGHNNSPRVAYEESGVTKYYYTGTNALEKYRMYMDDVNLVGIPIEDDGGAGTVNVHPEEHRIESKTRHIGGHPHKGLDDELMTGWTESGDVVMPLSAVSIGFLEDMGYEVDYSYADEYKGIKVDSNGDKILGTSLNSGANMKSTSGPYSTYSVVQYDVSVNYGIKNSEDISFNYRNGHDVSNIDIEVNTIIPDVSSIEIENILYTDTSGIVTITFNDHDGYYFHGKDASMNIYLDPSLNDSISLVMEQIPSDSKLWTGVITSISGEFYPDAMLYLKHNGMNGLINLDLSATYRLDTDIRGLYITLPEMVSRDTNSNQTINYLTYDHNTNKLDTDVSFQFNIDVSNNLEQFPYIDICENFISISSSNIVNGAVEINKGLGFIGRFWHGILTISGEINDGSFNIYYNEQLNPQRSDGVIEIRQDRLIVSVNTILPNINYVMAPNKLSYLDVSGDVEIEFNQELLTGDENNIQIEYSLENTNEYQFLDKYNDNAVSYSGSGPKYEFNGISYDQNKKIALGIGTYTLDISSSHPIYLNDNDFNYISINGTNITTLNSLTGYYGTVTIDVSGDFGTATYGCIIHAEMIESNRLVYKDVVVSPVIKMLDILKWKYTISLPQEIDTSLNVTIKYRDEISSPHIIPLYGIVPDISSVTLSQTDLTYNDPSCVLIVEFDKALEGRTNIYDLISLEPSEQLFIGSSTFTSTDNRSWIGTLDISNNETNEFAYTDAKVSVNGIQSVSFEQGLSGEVLFNIDTILPDVSNIIVSNLDYSVNNNNDTVTKSTDFTITFTKTDLSGIDISNNLSIFESGDFSINNVGPIIGNQLTGNIETNVSNIDSDFSFVLQYDFGYRYGSLNKDIDMSVNFTVDTVIRTVNVTSNYSNLTYLTPSCEITVIFNTNEEDGKDISNNISVKDTNGTQIGYTLNPYQANVIGNTWKATINILDNVDVSGIIDISYNNGIDNLYSQINNIRFYTIVPDVSSVTLSNTEISYENPSIDLQVEYNKVLENRNDIYDLITLNVSANLIEISGNNVSYDAQNNLFKGTIRLKDTSLHGGTSLYRFEDNLKVVVESLQSAMFSPIGISGESQLFRVDTLQQIEKIELDTHHIYYPDVSNTLTVDFRIPIPPDTNLNDYVTLNEGYIVSQTNFITENNGKKWTSTVSRVENMNLLDNKFEIDYSYNGKYNVSGEILFNAMENPEQRYMKFEEFGTSINGNNGEKIGTGIALSYNNQIMAISSNHETDNNNDIKIYRLNNSSWNQIGDISIKATSLSLSENGNILVLSTPEVIGDFEVGSVYVYKYNEDNSWNQIYKIEPEEKFTGYASEFGKSISISNNGNLIAVGISGYSGFRGFVKLYKRDTETGASWNPIIDLSGNINEMKFGSNVKLSGDGLTLAVGSPGYDNNKGKINVYSFDYNFNTIISNTEFLGENGNDNCGDNITLTNDGKIINYGLSESKKIIIQNLDNDMSYNFIHDSFNGISTISDDKNKLFIFEQKIQNSIRYQYINCFEFYDNYWNLLGTKEIITSLNEVHNVRLFSSNDGKQILYSNINFGSNNNGILKTYIVNHSIERRILNFDLNLSNILYPDISSNFTINFTTNDVSMEDISNNLSIDPSNMGIIEVIETANNGFNWVGKFTATELLKNDDNQLKYQDTLQENNVYTDTSFILFNIDRSPLDVSLLEITSSNSVSNHIRYDDVSGAIYLEFTRDQVTIDDATFETIIKENLKVLPINSGEIKNITTNDSGVSWTAIFEPSLNLITDCSLIFDYSGSEFELPIYRDYRFTIDTITPYISNIIVGNFSYTNTINYIEVIFSKNDLNDIEINDNFDLSFSVTDETLDSDTHENNFEIILIQDESNKVIGTYWKTQLDVSGQILRNVNITAGYTTNFVDVSFITTILIDTRRRGVETITITNDGNKDNNGVNYLFTYLDNSGEILIDFVTQDLSGSDISSDMSFNPNINYTVENSNVILDRYNAFITVDMEQYTTSPTSFNYIDPTDTNRLGTIDNIYIDTRTRDVSNISFERVLDYYDKEGLLTIIFDYNIFEDVDDITKKLVYDKDKLDLSNASINANIYTCTLTVKEEIRINLDVSINYNETTKSVSIFVDTHKPYILPTSTLISNKNIKYNDMTTTITAFFDVKILDLQDISQTLKVSGLQDTSYNFSTFETSNGGKSWSGTLYITEYDISSSVLYLYTNYREQEPRVANSNFQFYVNTIRPNIANFYFEKDILTYLEPSGSLIVEFTDSIQVLDNDIYGFINYNDSDITLSSFVSSTDKKRWTAIVNVYNEGFEKNIDMSINYYGQIQDISSEIELFTKIPQVTDFNLGGKVKFNYLDNNTTFNIQFANKVYDPVDDIKNSFQFQNFPSAYQISYNDNTIPYSTITGELKFEYDINITDAYIDYSYNTLERFSGKNQPEIKRITSIDTRIPNITEATSISNVNLTYDASSSQLDVYFDASLLDATPSSVLDASLVTYFDSTSFGPTSYINISSFVEINRRHYRANIITSYDIDNMIGGSVTVKYMDNTEILYFNVDTFLRPKSNICFPSGENVLTDSGYKNIKNIDILVDTIRGNKIEELTQTQTSEKSLVLIKCGALMKNMPNKNTLVTNNHNIFYKGTLIEACNLVKLIPNEVEFVDYRGQTLYNILLEGEEEGRMIVNGMIVETLSPKNNIASLYKKIKKYGTTEYKKKRMIELFNHNKKYN